MLRSLTSRPAWLAALALAVVGAGLGAAFVPPTAPVVPVPVGGITDAQRQALPPVPAQVYADLAAGRTTFVPPGTYNLPSTRRLKFTAPGQKLIGSGVGVTRFVCESAGSQTGGIDVATNVNFGTAGGVGWGYCEFPLVGAVAADTTTLNVVGPLPAGLGVGSRVVLKLGLQVREDPQEPERTVYAVVAALTAQRITFADPLGVAIQDWGTLDAVRAACRDDEQRIKVGKWGFTSPTGVFSRGTGLGHGLILLDGPLLTGCEVGGFDVVYPADQPVADGGIGVKVMFAPNCRVRDVRFVDPNNYCIQVFSSPGASVSNATAVGAGRGYWGQAQLLQVYATGGHLFTDCGVSASGTIVIDAEGDLGDIALVNTVCHSAPAAGAEPSRMQMLAFHGVRHGKTEVRGYSDDGTNWTWNTSSSGLILSDMRFPNVVDPFPIGPNACLNAPKLWGDYGSAWRTEMAAIPLAAINGGAGVLTLPDGLYKSARVRFVANGVAVTNVDPLQGPSWVKDNLGGWTPRPGAWHFSEYTREAQRRRLTLVCYAAGLPADAAAVVAMTWCPATP